MNEEKKPDGQLEQGDEQEVKRTRDAENEKTIEDKPPKDLLSPDESIGAVSEAAGEAVQKAKADADGGEKDAAELDAGTKPRNDATAEVASAAKDGQPEVDLQPSAVNEPSSAPQAQAGGKKDAAEQELAEAAAEVGKLTPEARASKTPLSADAQAAVERAAKNQSAHPSARTTSEPSDAPAAELAGGDEKAAKAKAAAEARAARASARAAKTDGAAEPAAPKEPSPNQPLLDRLVAILKDSAGEDAVVEASINERDAHLPCVVIKPDRWPAVALAMRDHEELKCDYLRNLSGVDQETHLEVAYHLLSLTHKRNYGVKVKTDREQPSVPSVTKVWPTANWNEREVYDLFGIDFPGHPDLRRIMMPDDWVGHPLRKDYEPLDPEV